MNGKTPRSAPTQKYVARRNAIVEAASAILNRKGLKGMTLADVGETFGMVATGVAYYYPSKEDLSAACFLRALEIFEQLISQAAIHPAPDKRIRVLIRDYFWLRKRIAEGEMPPFAQFDDVRALGDEKILNGYVQMFRNMRELLRPLLPAGARRAELNARTHLLVQQFLWVEAWLPKYDPDDYPRVADRVSDILLNGLGAGTRPWQPLPLSVVPARGPGDVQGSQSFLRAATELINEIGYLGASVERIAARLEVTKGAFYHHIDAKDDLVAICFARTTEAVRSTQKTAARLEAEGYDRLSSILISLVQHHFKGEMPLLRAATVSLPEAIRREVMNEYERNAVRFGSLLCEGNIDGSIRALDVQIAADMCNGVANGIGELPFFVPGPHDERTAESFVRPFFEGLISPLASDQRPS
ncbi:MAG TPA: TetR/AcrR family transcriptional regulator [Rhizomicrobium sp.]|nr:TetR/AcrR family transcriptional regulator [Rhizomicrobium sp.]